MALMPRRADDAPGKVVQEYCSLDLNGARVGGSLGVPRIFKLVTWTVEPGWDTITVVRSYRLIDSRGTNTEAEVRVQYQTLAEISATVLDPKTATETVTFVLHRFGSSWRIEKPVLQPHVSIQGAIAAEQQALGANDDPSDKRHIESTIKQLEALKNARN